jgi:hypothetical protein
MSERMPAEVRFASLESRAIYREPIIQRWNQNGEITQAVFRALREWNISLDQVSETQFAANLGQLETTFQLLQGRFIFRVGVGATGLTVWNPVWSETDVIGRIYSAGVEAVRTSVPTEFDHHEVTLDMHVAPAGRTVSELTGGFVPSVLQKCVGDDVRGYGFILHKSEGLWHLDSSAAFADSLFVRIFRRFPPNASMHNMAATMRTEEGSFLEVLGLSVAGVT